MNIEKINCPQYARITGEDKNIKSEIRKILLSSLVLISIIFISGCTGTDHIGDILSNPLKYEGKDVTIAGKVTELISIPLVNEGAYELSDGIPEIDEEVRVEGTVTTAFTLAGQSFGTVVIERSRGQN